MVTGAGGGDNVELMNKWFNNVFDFLPLLKVWDAPTPCSWPVEAAKLLSMTSDPRLMAAGVTQRQQMSLSRRSRMPAARLSPTTTQLKRATSWSPPPSRPGARSTS